MTGSTPPLPRRISRLFAALPENILDAVQEIRLRTGRPAAVYTGTEEYFLSDGGCTNDPAKALCAEASDIKEAIMLAAEHSLYSAEEQIKRGYITARGGYRIGICGTSVMKDGEICGISDISSLNYRIPHEIKGAAEGIMRRIYDGRPLSALIISPPGLGKTTMLRDTARLLSMKAGQRICVIDERSELAACVSGMPTMDVGPRTDVLDGCPKADGIMMAVRTMTPTAVITDEIGSEKDCRAIEEAARMGTAVIASAHARCMEEAAARPGLAALFEKKIFARIITLGSSRGTGTAEKIQDEHGRLLYTAPSGGRHI